MGLRFRNASDVRPCAPLCAFTWASCFRARTLAVGIAVVLWSVSPVLLRAQPLAPNNATGVPSAESATLPNGLYPTRSRFSTRDLTAAPAATSINIGEVSAAELQAQSTPSPKPGAPRKTGFSRSITQLADATKTAANLNWRTSTNGGAIAAISVTSPGALGIRLGVVVVKLPPQATLRFYAQSSGNSINIPAQKILSAIKQNQAAGDSSARAMTYWSPHIDGPELTLEIELPPGVGPDQVQIALPSLVHFFTATPYAAPAQTGPTGLGTSALCEVDASCYPAWNAENNATAILSFVNDSGESYLCTGELINANPQTFVPYLLSANHCISDQTTATSLETIWFYQSTSCNSGAVNPNYVVVGEGARLLYQSAPTDTSFMWMGLMPPGGVSFVGWSASLPALQVPAIGIHHPKGDLAKISGGFTTAYANCVSDSADSEEVTCTPTVDTTSDHIQVSFVTGITEQGSSGSGIYIAGTAPGSHQLVGQLHAGTASCSNPTGWVAYGRLDQAYYAALYKWLEPSTSVVLTTNSIGNGSGSIVSLPAGIECGSTCSITVAPASYLTLIPTPSAGSIFTGWAGACSGNTPTCEVQLSESTNVSAVFESQAVAPQTGYWWNPAESGHGYVIEIQESSMFMAGFLYAGTGEATWVASTGPMTSPTEYSGPLITFSGGQTLTGQYQSPTQESAPLGNIDINFSSPSTATLSWPGGIIPIQRFDFGPGGSQSPQPQGTPQTGWWWNPAEAGRGFALEVQGGSMYLAGYMYDPQGNPIWFVSDGIMASPTLYQSVWQQYENGQTLTGSYQPASVANADVGSVTIQFATPTTATMTLPNGRQIPFERFTFNNSSYANLAGTWSGSYQWSGLTSNFCQVSDSGTLSMTITQTGANIWGTNVSATGFESTNATCSFVGTVSAEGGVASGVISGSTVKIAFDLPGSTGFVVSFTGSGTLIGNTIFGTMVRSTGGSGTFTLTLQ